MKINLSDLRYIYAHTLVPGTEVLYVIHPIAPMPIAHVYFRQIMVKHLDILDMYVYDIIRRQGVATRMLQSLALEYPGFSVVTEQGNKLSTPWLKKMGFEKTIRGWELPFARKVIKGDTW